MSEARRLKLHVAPPWGDPFERLLLTDFCVIGRSSRADVTVHDSALSREHARLCHREGEWFVEDLNSRNGTFLNGRAVDGPTKVGPGDLLAVGGTTVTLAEAAPPPRPVDLFAPGQSLFRPLAELIPEAASPPPPAGGGGDALTRYAERLRIMNEVHHALSGSCEQKELLNLILDRVFDHLKPQEGAIFLRGPGGEYTCAAQRSTASGPVVVSRHLVTEVGEKGLGALVLDAEHDARFAGAASIVAAGVRSLLAAPLMDASGPLGMIFLSSKVAVRSFTEEDLELLATLASAASLRIRNIQLARESAERRRLEDEISLARRIQLNLLPTRLPDVEGYAFLGRNLPSRHVSGDFYQVLTRSEGREVVLMVADVSGKGIAAALLTASLEALLAAPIEAGREPAQIFARVGGLLHRRTPPEKFATAFLAVLDVGSGRLAYSGAGHPPALLVRESGETEWLDGRGFPLGILPDAEYDQGETLLRQGDTLLLYTDGITEAMNPDHDLYESDRLEAVVRDHRRLDLHALAAVLEKDLETFAQGEPFADDRTAVLLRRL